MNGDQQGQGTGNPFEQHIKRAAPQGPPNPFETHTRGAGTATLEPPSGEPNPFEAHIETPHAPGAAEIAAADDLNYKQNIEVLKTYLDRPDITPAQRQRIEGMIKRYTEPEIAGFAVGNRVTDPDRTAAENFARGFGAGAVNYGILGATDLIAAGTQLLLPKSLEKMVHLPQFRQNVADSQQIVKEWFDPQGYAGGAGTVVGAFAPGFLPTTAVAKGGSIATAVFKPFEVLNSAGFKALSRLSPKAASIVAKGTVPTATFLQRLSAQMVGSSAVDAVQLADVLTNEDMTTEQKIRALAFTAIASGGAATAASIRRIKPTAEDIQKLKDEAKVTKTSTTEPTPPAAPAEGAKPERATEAEKLAKGAVDQAERAKQNRRLANGARAEWEAQNLEKNWKKDLTEEQRQEIVRQYKLRYAKTTISQAQPQPAPAQAPVPPAGAPSPETAAPAPARPAPTTATVPPPEVRAAAAGVEGVPPVVPGRQAVEAAVVAPPPTPAGSERPGETPIKGVGETQIIGEKDPAQAQPEQTPVDAEINKLQAELAQTRQQRDEAVRAAEVDAMTGVANAQAWFKAIVRGNDDPGTHFLLFDLLNVKYMNDHVSRTEADQYIIDAARAIETAVRTLLPDVAGHPQAARVFRYGGDEFGVILPAGVDPEKVSALAKQIMGQSSAGGYPLGLRSAHGPNTTLAEAAMQAVKKGEKHPKFRGAAPERLVPGIELKKPLTDHTVEELDKLYDAIDKLHENKLITDEQYGEGIRSISATKLDLKKAGVTVESLAPAKGTPKAPKADPKAAVDAGLMPGELKTADPRVNEGFAFWGGQFVAITRQVLEDIKTSVNAEIARKQQQREQVLALPDNETRASAFENIFGSDIGLHSKGAAISFIERKIKEAKSEIDRFTRQHARYNEANPSQQPPPRANPADVTGSAVVRTTQELPAAKLAPELRPTVDAAAFRKAFASRVDKMTTEGLTGHRDDLQNRVNAMDKKTAKDSGYLERLAKVNEEIAKRANKDASGAGVELRTDPRVVGFALGFSSGLVMPADDDQERFRNALYLGAAGALGSHAIKRRLQVSKVESLPAYQREIREHVRSVEDAPLEKRKGMFSFLLEVYGNIARRDIGITAATHVAGGAELPASRNPGKLAQMFGLYGRLADQWLFGDRIGTFDENGNWVQFDAIPLQQIAGMVDGDLRTVGDLAAARRELELRNLPEPKTTGLRLETARQMYANTAERYHAAAAELTKFFRAMRDLSVMGGILSPESAAKMDEQTFYVAVRRLFGNEPGKQPNITTVKGKGKDKTAMRPENPFKYLKGGKGPYQNPVEAAIDLLPRYHKAVELNRLATKFFDMLSAIPASDRKLIGRRLSRAETPKIAGEDVKIQQLRDELAAQGHHLSEDEAHAFISALSDESLNVTDDIIRFYRNGQMEAWQVSEPIAKSFRSLQAHEMEAVLAGMGIATGSTNLARVGITANPVFIGFQAIRDVWQYFMNGTYALQGKGQLLNTAYAPIGLAESGVGNIRGWLAQMFNTQEYRNFAAAGGGGESVASQGLRTLRGDVKKSTDLLEKLKEKPARNQFEKILNEVKTMQWREAYASMMAPIADAGRVGAYLKERGRGHDVLEAVYRSKKAGGNFSNRGAALWIQGLNKMTLFLNPGIQGVDASRHAFQKDPMGYIVRGIAGITLPSLYFWAANKDDDEIRRLRGTPSGKRFWYFRFNGDIRKIPKPIFDGQVFGSSVEAYMDAMYEKDPQAVRNWAEAMYNDAAVNLLPFIGAVPATLLSGKIWGFGSDLIPEGVENLDVEYRSRPDNTLLARTISKVTAPTARAVGNTVVDRALSPAGIDYLIQTYLGGLGSEGAKTLSIAMDVANGGQMPPKEELPFVRALFGQYPSMNTTPILEFYRNADKYEDAANTANFLARTDPAKLATYLDTRANEIMLANMYASARQKMADQRRAIADVQEASDEIMDDKTRRDLIDTYMRMLIEQADITNQIARSINESNK